MRGCKNLKHLAAKQIWTAGMTNSLNRNVLRQDSIKGDGPSKHHQGKELYQAYTPTSAAEDEEVERFYEEHEEAMNTRCTYLIVMGDFNAKVGCRKDNKAFVGPFGERNE
uniref:Craniofacial development protein 2-like n=1 Tax=Plectus sambesii TaxID=2011161 RepID=A0A914VTT7_9BILA